MFLLLEDGLLLFLLFLLFFPLFLFLLLFYLFKNKNDIFVKMIYFPFPNEVCFLQITFLFVIVCIIPQWFPLTI